MHCPNCGAKATDDQKFCRSCGLSLESISAFFSERVTPAQMNLLDKQRKIERWRGIAYRTTLGIIATGLLGLFIYELAIEDSPLDILIIIPILIVLIGAILSVSLNIYSGLLREKLTEERSPKWPSLSGRASSTLQLPEVHYEPVPSVTEGTTEMLVSEKKQRSENT